MGQSRIKHNRSIGILMIIINSIWLYTGLERLYGQNYGGIVYMLWYPNWLILISIFCSISGIFLGVYVLKRRIKTQYGIIINITLIIIYSFINLHTTS